MLTPLYPSSHAPTPSPFLAPAAFLQSIQQSTNTPRRPYSSLWRASGDPLRAIKYARKLLEPPIAGLSVSEEKKQQLPRYVVVVSGNDLGEDELDLEDGVDEVDWRTLGKNFTKGPHSTTLFSLISLGYTPNLEQFWKDCSCKFPTSLVYSSLSPNPTIPFSFPLLHPSHAAFLTGFYNNRPQPNAPPPPATASPAPQTTTQFLNSSPAAQAQQIKRAPSTDAASAAAKKAKAGVGNGNGAAPNPDAVANYMAAAKQKQAGQGGAVPSGAVAGAGIQRAPSQPQAGSAQASRKPTPNLGTIQLPPQAAGMSPEKMQQYVNDLKAAAARSGQPQPNLHAALQAYVQAGSGQPVGPVQQSQPSQQQPGQQPSQQQQAFMQQQQHQLQQQLASQNQQQQAGGGQDGKPAGTQQANALPQIPPEMRANIEQRLNQIRAQSSSGAISQEEANKQVQQLQQFTHNHRVQLAKQQLAAQQGQAQQQSQPPPNPAPSQANPAAAAGFIWQGAISWSFGGDQTGQPKQDFVIYCRASPVQPSAMDELKALQLPGSLKIGNMPTIKLTQLQDLASKQGLPAMKVVPIPNGDLPENLKQQQQKMNMGNARGNEELYTLFAQSMEARSNCATIRTNPNTNNGLILVPMPGKTQFLMLVFNKAPIPQEWLGPAAQGQAAPGANQAMLVAQAQQQAQQAHAQQQQQQQTAMFANQVNMAQQQAQAQLAQQQQNQAKAQQMLQQQQFAQRMQQQQQQQQAQQQQQRQVPQQAQQQQQAVTGGGNVGGVAGMSFEQLQSLLGPEQLKLMMGGQ